MSTNFLPTASLIVSGLAIIISIFSIYYSGKAHTWRKYFRLEEQPENLEDIIEKVASKIKIIEDNETDIALQLNKLEKTLDTATQHVGVVRFDSGSDDGGNLSFAAAFLDAHQSGLVLTSLHGRQHNRIYSKIVRQGKSEQALSGEEQEAIIQALTQPKS